MSRTERTSHQGRLGGGGFFTSSLCLMTLVVSSAYAFAPPLSTHQQQLHYPRHQPQHRLSSSSSLPSTTSATTACFLHSRQDFIRGGLAGATTAALIVLASPSLVWADEYGVETEAPTLYTGETVEICTKRGPLGACLQTEIRTVQNDNDKAQKYFRGVTTQKQQLAEEEASLSGNALIEKLRQQTLDNKERNELEVARRTFENDQSATFGPFDKQVLIMNTDGKSFTLLQNPQAMRLKKQGFIEGRKFVKQPTDDEIEKALAPEEGGLFAAIFGGSS